MIATKGAKKNKLLKNLSFFCWCAVESIASFARRLPGQNASSLELHDLTLTTTGKMSDRRREERLDVCLDAVWDGTSGNYTARVTDLSEGGCYVDTLGDAHVGEILSFKIQTPAGEWLELTGEVAHETPPLGFGLRFVYLADEQLDQLRSLIAHFQNPADPVNAS
jgi:hypothetical protein